MPGKVPRKVIGPSERALEIYHRIVASNRQWLEEQAAAPLIAKPYRKARA